MKRLSLLCVAACATPTAPRNQLGVIAGPGAVGAEGEHFVDEDRTWSVGVTLGVVWRGVDDLLAPPRKQGGTLVAVNPFVRWHAWRPTDWLALGIDAKVSLVWVMPETAETRFALSFESHGFGDAGYTWAHALLGVGVKQFVTTADVDGSRFPSQMTMPAGEAAAGVRF